MSFFFRNIIPTKVVLWITGALVASLLLLPIGYLLLRASEAGDSIWNILFSARTVRVLLKTVYLAHKDTVVSFIIRFTVGKNEQKT